MPVPYRGVPASTYANSQRWLGGAELTKAGLTSQFAKTTTRVVKDNRRAAATHSKSMLYKPHTPMELGDAVLGQFTGALVFLFDHMIPAVHSVVSWETDDIDLGPIIPVGSRIVSHVNFKTEVSDPLSLLANIRRHYFSQSSFITTVSALVVGRGAHSVERPAAEKQRFNHLKFKMVASKKSHQLAPAAGDALRKGGSGLQADAEAPAQRQGQAHHPGQQHAAAPQVRGRVLLDAGQDGRAPLHGQQQRPRHGLRQAGAEVGLCDDVEVQRVERLKRDELVTVVVVVAVGRVEDAVVGAVAAVGRVVGRRDDVQEGAADVVAAHELVQVAAVGQHLEIVVRRRPHEAVPAAVEKAERVRVVVQAAQEAPDAAHQQQQPASERLIVVPGHAPPHRARHQQQEKAADHGDDGVPLVPRVFLLEDQHHAQEEVLHVALQHWAPQVHEVNPPHDEAHDGANVVQPVPLPLGEPQRAVDAVANVVHEAGAHGEHADEGLGSSRSE
ncbi:hypothetical protein ON010_g6313 [Phytophthora cinnamomi]|nr:hypothetical protein ON010_g6313 [Phytophthora cinnamomi]